MLSRLRGERALAIRFILAVVLSVLVAAPAWAAPSAVLWDRWTEQDAASKQIIDHSFWDGFIKSFVVRGGDGINRVAYARALKEQKALSSYLKQLQLVPIGRYNRNEQLAYWINLYNALTVSMILENYPVGSIKEITLEKKDASDFVFGLPKLLSRLFSDGPWDGKLAMVQGVELSLNDIEHRILRPIWKDPRIHYALNCAAIGCPNLQGRAFTGANAETLLEKGARDFVNHPRAVTIKEEKGLFVSSLYIWYMDDFGGKEINVLRHLHKYAHPILRSAIGEFTEISGDEYDWSLNEAR
ncbi:MAG: DUF547 domain-containing protein [Rhodospirillales bacterium]|nr:DUF547 domain-containing protein [Rhodospirillales bacterium]